MNFFKCPKCGRIITSTDKNVECCGIMLDAIDVKYEFNEKHTPNYEINENEVKVFVNHVMNNDHYIEFIAIVDNDDNITVKSLKLDENPSKTFIINDDVNGIKLYALCNTHGLFTTTIKS